MLAVVPGENTEQKRSKKQSFSMKIRAERRANKKLILQIFISQLHLHKAFLAALMSKQHQCCMSVSFSAWILFLTLLMLFDEQNSVQLFPEYQQIRKKCDICLDSCLLLI